MKITIEAKPLEIKAELPGYGVFYVRKMGAGAEMDLMARMSSIQEHMEEVRTKYAKLFDKENKLIADKDNAGLAELKNSAEYKEALKAQEEINKQIQSHSELVNRTMLNLWRSDNSEAVKKLLADFTITQIQGFYKQVMEQADNA